MPAGSVRSVPWSSMVMPRASVSLPGPLVRSMSRRALGRSAASPSIPETGMPARSSTAPPSPSGLVTTLQHTCRP